MARLTACIRCGMPTTNGSRCLTCNRGYRRGVRNRQYDTPQWRKRRAQVLAQHREQHGDICPGYGRPAHRTNDLTVDHIQPLSKGGELLGATQVLCRSCNSRKRNRADGDP